LPKRRYEAHTCIRMLNMKFHTAEYKI